MIRKAIIVVLTLGAGTVAIETGRSSNEPVLHEVVPNLLIQFFKSETAVLGLVDADPQAANVQMSWLGFGLQRRRMSDSETNAYAHTAYVVLFPSLIGVGVLAAYPTTAFNRGPFRRWRRHRKGLCIRCGYDLAGNVSSVCPECGEAR